LVSHITERIEATCFESRVLWRIFAAKREEVAGGWRRQRNEELRNL
jgi:hypothetical protein